SGLLTGHIGIGFFQLMPLQVSSARHCFSTTISALRWDFAVHSSLLPCRISLHISLALCCSPKSERYCQTAFSSFRSQQAILRGRATTLFRCSSRPLMFSVFLSRDCFSDLHVGAGKRIGYRHVL